MRSSSSSRVLLLMAVALVLVPACKKSSPPAPAPRPTTPPPAAGPAPQPAAVQPDPAGEWESAPSEAQTFLSAEEINRRNLLKKIFFDTDRAEIRADMRATLQANAAWLREHADVRILIEGHCDERNTREYNLALGDRRAQAARDYLISLGIGADRIETISYGEERPAVMGTGEAVWSQNRRAEFQAVSAGGTN